MILWSTFEWSLITLAFCGLWYILNPQVTLLIYLLGSLQPRAPPVLSHPNRPSWPVLIPRPGASWVPRPTMPTQSPRARRGWVAWQGHLPRTRFQITGTMMRVNEESFPVFYSYIIRITIFFLYLMQRMQNDHSLAVGVMCGLLYVISEMFWVFFILL